ncbi:hypothetical protein JD969_10225 [Planctomycetota bacterium]|nr:hypothetical protein JD969_10225 [Planctomycetota bacterium]
MSAKQDDKKLNQTLFGVNIVLLTLLVIGMVVYFNIRHKRKVEIEQQITANQQLDNASKATDKELAAADTADLKLPSRDVNATDTAEADTKADEAVMADVDSSKDDAGKVKVTMAEDIKDILDDEPGTSEDGVVSEMSIDYSKGKDLLSGTDRARLILLETKDMKLVDQLVAADEKHDKNAKKKISALDKAAANSNGRRPNYGKVRKGLIGVAEALVRLNTKIVEVEPLKTDEEQEAVTSLDYDQ